MQPCVNNVQLRVTQEGRTQRYRLWKLVYSTPRSGWIHTTGGLGTAVLISLDWPARLTKSPHLTTFQTPPTPLFLGLQENIGCDMKKLFSQSDVKAHPHVFMSLMSSEGYHASPPLSLQAARRSRSISRSTTPKGCKITRAHAGPTNIGQKSLQVKRLPRWWHTVVFANITSHSPETSSLSPQVRKCCAPPFTWSCRQERAPLLLFIKRLHLRTVSQKQIRWIVRPCAQVRQHLGGGL